MIKHEITKPQARCYILNEAINFMRIGISGEEFKIMVEKNSDILSHETRSSIDLVPEVVPHVIYFVWNNSFLR